MICLPIRVMTEAIMHANAIYTIGHSKHEVTGFLQLLADHCLQVVVDVRSAPYSRHVPRFNKQLIQDAILAAGLRYLYLGDAIGGKPADPAFRDGDGRIVYSRVAESEKFRNGISRLRKGLADGWRIVLMCAEEDPARCHRHLLIARELVLRHHIPVLHIRRDGSLRPAADLLQQEYVQPRLPIFSR